MEASDQELLRAFVRERSEDAFRQMVSRHLNLVFATARRILGDPQLAEEVAQGVFLLLARKAGEIGNQQPLAGWLYHTARHHALNASRAEGRRRQREQTAAAMQTNETTPEPEWIAAELEGALEELPAEDRDALVLRFLDNRQLREVGVELGISEEAARKRVSRALDKLRGIFGKRGVALSTGLLTTALAAQACAAAPAGLGATIVASALTGLTAAGATAIVATQTTASIMNLFNLKTAAAILGAAAVTGTTTYFVQERAAERLRADHQMLNETHARLTNEQQEAEAIIQLRDEQIAALKRDVSDLPRLRGDIDKLRRENLELEGHTRMLAAMARNEGVVDESASLVEAIEIARQADTRRHYLLRNRLTIVKSSYAQMLHQALMTVAEANEGRYPDNMGSVLEHVGSKMYHEGLRIDDRSISATDFEIVYQGSILGIQDPANTAFFRERVPLSIGGGKTVRVVYFANGRAENVEESFLPSGDLEVRRPRDPSADFE